MHVFWLLFFFRLANPHLACNPSAASSTFPGYILPLEPPDAGIHQNWAEELKDPQKKRRTGSRTKRERPFGLLRKKHGKRLSPDRWGRCVFLASYAEFDGAPYGLDDETKSLRKKTSGFPTKNALSGKNCYYSWHDLGAFFFFGLSHLKETNQRRDDWGELASKRQGERRHREVCFVGRARGVGPGILPKHQVVFQLQVGLEIENHPIQKEYCRPNTQFLGTMLLLIGICTFRAPRNFTKWKPVFPRSSGNSVSSKCSKLN